MDHSQGNPVLRRKLGRRAPAAAVAGQVGARHLSRALARATSSIPGLVGSCGEPARRIAAVAELLDLVDAEAFVALIADPSGAVGLAVFDPVSTVALIEAMTIGRLSRKPPPQRRATQTDALLLRDVIDAALEEYDRHAGADPDHRSGFRFQRFPVDYRLLDLLLEARRFDLILQPLALLDEDARRDGQFLLALPQTLPSASTEAADAPAAERHAAPGARGDAWARALEAQVMAAPTELSAVLGRVTLPLSEVMGLSVGNRLNLPLAKLEEVEIEALDGQVLGQGRLGQYRAMRAVRLIAAGHGNASAVPDFEDHGVTRPSAAPPAEPVPGAAASDPE